MIYTKNNRYELHLGKMQDVLATFQSESVDAVVTDPPYELNFMGKGWDNSGVAFQKETWQHCYRVLKPGGYLLAFGGTRTFHRIACAIEDAGFEIRDTIMWLYGSGFPKSMNIGKGIEAREKFGNACTRNKRLVEQGCDGESRVVKQPNNGVLGTIIEATRKDYVPGTDSAKEWAGWGTCLKPAYEPIIVARKPFKGSLVDNVLENGVGGLNIDECRIELEKDFVFKTAKRDPNILGDVFTKQNCRFKRNNIASASEQGRFPANVILTYDETDKDEVCGGMPNADNEDSASRYFYCAKASKRDRDEGLDLFENKVKVFNGKSDQSSKDIKDVEQRFTTVAKNIHPTVKPVALMQYLIRLVCPKGSVILDPFNGSGSTGKAVMYENNDRDANYYYIGVEMTEEYLPISKARIDYAIRDKEKVEFDSEPVEKDSDKNNKSKQYKIDLW